jgi:hypothetical protein
LRARFRRNIAWRLSICGKHRGFAPQSLTKQINRVLQNADDSNAAVVAAGRRFLADQDDCDRVRRHLLG